MGEEKQSPKEKKGRMGRRRECDGKPKVKLSIDPSYFSLFCCCLQLSEQVTLYSISHERFKLHRGIDIKAAGIDVKAADFRVIVGGNLVPSNFSFKFNSGTMTGSSNRNNDNGKRRQGTSTGAANGSGNSSWTCRLQLRSSHSSNVRGRWPSANIFSISWSKLILAPLQVA